MDMSPRPQQINPLRVITQRLAATPSCQLPHIVPQLANLVTLCRQKFSTSSSSNQSGSGSEDVVLTHKYKTQLSTLLQDRNSQARYAALVLIKATIETGGWNILREAAPWVRGLMGIIGKPDPHSTKRLCIVTLTRIFVLTHEHQTLVREITTPSLPGFISACLKIVSRSQTTQSIQKRPVSNEVLPIVLQSFAELIPLHPSAFRPILSQIQALILPLLAPTPSNATEMDQELTVPLSTSTHARRLYALLHACAPKNTAADDWTRSLDNVIKSIHATADAVFRSLIEDWTSSTVMPILDHSKQVEGEVADLHPEFLALPRWHGIYAGMERLEGLLQILQGLISTKTLAAVEVPVGRIMDAADRMLSAILPSESRNPRTRPEIGRDEREGLFFGLPHLHVATINLMTLLISRLGFGAAALTSTIVDQVTWLFDSECHISDIREAVYRLVSIILKQFGPSLNKRCAETLTICIVRCCEDLLPSDNVQSEMSLANGHAKNGFKSSINATIHLEAIKPKVGNHGPLTRVQQAALALLPLCLVCLPSGCVPAAVRTQIDRTAIAINDKSTLLASTMTPTSRLRADDVESSLMPFLARHFPDAPEVEALMHPQMPVVQRRSLEEVQNDFADEYIGQVDHPEPPHTIASHDINHEIQEAFVNANNQNMAPAMRNDSVAINEHTDQMKEDNPIADFAISSVSQKRSRDDSPAASTGAVVTGVAGLRSLPAMDSEQDSKRVRLAKDSERNRSPAKEAAFKDQPAVQEQRSEANALSLGSTGAQLEHQNGNSSMRVDIERRDSDDSDFEIPELHIGLTDEEYDDEEEEPEEDKDIDKGLEG